MATPVVAGSAALLRQYFTDGFWPSGAANPADAFVPSAALLRAVLIGGAVAIGGVEANANGLPVDPPPSSRQGFGRIHLGAREGLRRLGRWEGASWVKRSASQQGACNLGHMLPAQLPPNCLQETLSIWLAAPTPPTLRCWTECASHKVGKRRDIGCSGG